MTASVEAYREANAGVLEVRRAAQRHVEAIRAAAKARADRDALLGELVASIVGQPNPMTNKPHSATSATEAAKELPAYVEAQGKVLDADCRIVLAVAEYDAAKLTAQLLVAAYQS